VTWVVMFGFGDMLVTFDGTAVMGDWTTDTVELLVSTDCTVVILLQLSDDITYVMAGELSPVELVEPTEFKLSWWLLLLLLLLLLCGGGMGRPGLGTVISLRWQLSQGCVRMPESVARWFVSTFKH